MNVPNVIPRTFNRDLSLAKRPVIELEKRQSRPRLSPRLILGLILLLVIVFTVVFADTLAPYDMAAMDPAVSLQAPSVEHPFGTDLFGRDLFSRVLHGSRLSLSVALITVTIAAIPGLLLGMIAGMYPGMVSNTLSFLMDAWLVVPGLLLAIAMAAAFGRTTLVLGVALGLAGIPIYYRQARAETLRVRGELYIEAAQSLGANRLHVLICHVLPNVLPTLIVLVTIRAGGILLAVSAFSFIGLGAQPPEPEWGALLADGRDYLHMAGWLTFFPGLAIAWTVFGLNLVGDGLRDVLDPHKPGSMR